MRPVAIVFGLLLIVSVLVMSASAASSANYTERGRYIYDESNRIPLDAELGMNALLFSQDRKTGYETVVVFTEKTMSIEEMGIWFDNHGVGKAEEGNGVVIFVFADNSVYGMVGAGHDEIAVPLLTDAGQKALKNLDKDPVLSMLNLLNILAVQLDGPTTTQADDGIGKKILDNFDIIAAVIGILAGSILLWNQRDGFQPDDFKIPAIVFVVAILIVGGMGVLAQVAQDTETQYGVVMEDHPSSHMITEDHSYTDADGNYHHRTDTHIIYTNDAKVTSYDFQPYDYRFESRDFSSAWDYKPGVPVQLQVGVKNNALYWAGSFHDYSGGKTDWYGCWMRYANTSV
jgi:hypothetical protein